MNWLWNQKQARNIVSRSYVDLRSFDFSQKADIKAFKSFEGAPSLKLKLQVADLSANKVRVEIGNDDLWQNGRLRLLSYKIKEIDNILCFSAFSGISRRHMGVCLFCSR